MTSRQDTGVTHRAATDRGELAHPAEVAPGVTVTWDPAHPHRCADVTIADDGEHDPAGVDTVPWLRLAAVAVLDRQVYLPLDQSLVNAEYAAAQLDAARTLGTGDPLRELLMRRALVGARSASRGVVARLAQLATDLRRPPPVLSAAMDGLVRRYAALAGEVGEFDHALAAVVETGHRMASARHGSVRRGATTVVPPAPPTAARNGVDRIDPRSVPARVLRFGPAWDTAEVDVTGVRTSTGPAVRVRVRAFSPHGRESDVGLQLLDRRSGSVQGYGLLGRPVPSDGSGPPSYEGVVSLPPALVAADVRVELFDAADGPPSAPSVDEELGRARRATLFLSGWRALVADVRLWGVRTAPAARLREIVRRVTDGAPGGADDALWSGGPTRSHLRHLGELSDQRLTAWLRDGRDPAGSIRTADDGADASVVAAVSGPGDLLVAEVVAAHERSRARSRS